MRSTSAAEASSMRLSWSTKPVACNTSGRSLLASIGVHLVLIAMMVQPGCGKAFSAFLLEQLIHQAVIFFAVAGYAVQDEPTKSQRERPLAAFPQLIVVVALLLHDRNLVNRGVFQADLAVNGPNHRLARLLICQIEAYWAGLNEHRPHLRAEDLRERVRHKAQTHGFLARGHHPLLTLLLDPWHAPGNRGVIEEQQHGAVGAHLKFHLRQHIAQQRAK